MKKTHLLITIFILSVGFTNAQKEKIIGNWLVTQVEFAGEVEYPYMNYNFSEDGRMIILGVEVGTWTYNKGNHSIVMKSEFDKDFNGESTILKLTKKDLIVEKEDTKVTYQKLDKEKNSSANESSGLIGKWEYKNPQKPDTETFITFTAPNEFIMSVKETYHEDEFTGHHESTTTGTWIFNKKDKTIILICYRNEILPKGKSKLTQLNNKSFVLENNDKIFKANKVQEIVQENKKAESTINIEHLTFSFEDFFTEEGDYKYDEDKAKLPWLNWREMKRDLLNVKQLVYSYDSKNQGDDAFKNETLTTNVIANSEDDGFTIEHIFLGYISTGNPEPRTNTDLGNPLYPLEDSLFRIAGNEQITTTAGTFDCTIIEVSNDYDMNKKLWLINDKIGVYAKIIDENTTENSSYYHLYMLQEIIYTD